jgi:hypothetical protein
MKSFKLVNPIILGKFNTEYQTESGIEAVSQFWSDLGSHITNNMPALYVTLKDNNNELSHYKISEKLSGGSKVANYTITELENSMSSKDVEKFLSKVNTYEKKINKKIQKQTGGVKSERKRHKDSSSSSSSVDSDDYYNFTKYKRLTQPISMWYYTPSIYGVNSVFVPTFNVPIVPYVKIWIPTWV